MDIGRSSSLGHMNYCTALLVLSFCSALSPSHASTGEGGRQPSYMGRSLCEWVDVLGTPNTSSTLFANLSDVPGGPEAKAAIEGIGAAGIPFLVTWITEEIPSSPTGSNGARAASLEPELPSRALGALQAFRILGPAAKPAVPELARIITDRLGRTGSLGAGDQGRIRPPCALLVLPALAEIGPEGLPVLLNVATNLSATRATRTTALAAISRMGSKAASAVPAVIQCATDANEEVVAGAIYTLGAVGAGQPEALAVLTNVLQNPSWHFRFCAADALKSFGGQAASALVAALSDADDRVRTCTLISLIHSAPQSLTNETALTAMARALRSKDVNSRYWAAQALDAAAQQDRGEKPTVRLPHRDLDVACQQATNILRRLAPAVLTNPASQ